MGRSFPHLAANPLKTHETRTMAPKLLKRLDRLRIRPWRIRVAPSSPSPLRIALAEQLEQRAGRLDFAPGRSMGARSRVPGVDVEMRPGLCPLDEAAEEEWRGDRDRHARARAR